MASANEMTLAMHRAKQAVKLDLRSKGEKVQRYSAAEISQLAKARLTPEFIAETAKHYADILKE
jgi:hypothetical protein